MINYNKILVLCLAGVGDTLMASPMISELRKKFPKSQIDCVVMWKSSKNILDNNHDLNNIFQFNMINEGIIKTLLFCNRLRNKGYDLSINAYPQGRIHYRVIARLINAKLRISHDYQNFKFLDKVLVSKKIKEDYNLHCIENNINLLKLLDINPEIGIESKLNYKIHFRDNELEYANRFMRENKLEKKILIGFHIGTSLTKNLALRRWPLDNYIELVKKLLEDDRVIILLFGSKEEEEGNNKISSLNQERIFNTKTENIKDSAAIIKKCQVFISVDTSLMHLASAVDVKYQIVIETPTFNKTVYPYNRDFINIKNPSLVKDKLEYYSYDGYPIKASDKDIINMMKSIKVDDVYNAIKGILIKG